MKKNPDCETKQEDRQKEIKEFSYSKQISLTADELKKNMLSKDPDGNCVVLIDGKETDCKILTMSSNGRMSIGVK